VGEAYQIADDIHDVKKHLLKGWVSSEEIASLTPALLHFVGGAEQHVVPFLTGQCSSIKDPLAGDLRLAVDAMEREIESRLKSAVEEVRGVPVEGLGDLVRCAPRELIALFNAQ
jgi:hypothetical protein